MSGRYTLRFGPPGGTPKGVTWLLIATFVVFVLQMLPGSGNFLSGIFSEPWYRFGGFGPLVPFAVFRKGEVWRLVTYMFLHGSALHLLFNLLALWMFGVEIEQIWGTRRFVIFYFIAGVGAGLLSFFMPALVPIVGASGAVLGLLAVYAFYFPNRRVLMFFIFPMPVWIAVAVIGFLSLAMARTGSDNIAHLVHLGGIGAAFVYLWVYDPFMRSVYHPAARWLASRRERTAESHWRSDVERRFRAERHMEEIIDPILKKISEHGMDSLTEDERRKLMQASRAGGGHTKRG